MGDAEMAQLGLDGTERYDLSNNTDCVCMEDGSSLILGVMVGAVLWRRWPKVRFAGGGYG